MAPGPLAVGLLPHCARVNHLGACTFVPTSSPFRHFLLFPRPAASSSAHIPCHFTQSLLSVPGHPSPCAPWRSLLLFAPVMSPGVLTYADLDIVPSKITEGTAMEPTRYSRWGAEGGGGWGG